MNVALLLRDREAPPEAAPTNSEPPPAPDGGCTQCGASLGRNQDWCLECGAPAPGRIGGKPAGWRAAFTLIAATLLLVGGAVVASYAALTGDAERDAARPSAGDGAPIVAQAAGPDQAPAAPAEPTGPGTDPSALKPKGNAAQNAGQPPRLNLPNPAKPAAPAPSAQPAKPAKPAAPPVIDVEIPSDGPLTYDPSKRPGAEFGSARKATDGKPATVWDVTMPADGAPMQVGLVVDLGAAYTLSSVKIDTPTPGFAVELYGSASRGVPDDILDKRWEHLADGKGVTDGQTLSVAGRSEKKLRKIVLWFTAPRDADDPRVAISEVSVRGSE